MRSRGVGVPRDSVGAVADAVAAARAGGERAKVSRVEFGDEGLVQGGRGSLGVATERAVGVASGASYDARAGNPGDARGVGGVGGLRRGDA